ncbi:hypothetical protein [Helicobacter sp. 11S02629-2]|uniref:hypothetical protein n=1 Tax=Helicobacter sp. 11S02629-2 TaxID=1476195 RepID=UPI000BA6E209|nr:hypothetical protein [Helicobacter sp. 11S02629-2]PAF44618.1 hypothetical protein BKH40_05145 [Helicobacter sp. 11S02629-2]
MNKLNINKLKTNKLRFLGIVAVGVFFIACQSHDGTHKDSKQDKISSKEAKSVARDTTKPITFRALCRN